jgi:hypothetical protein
VIHRWFIDTRYGVGGMGLYPRQLFLPFPELFEQFSLVPPLVPLALIHERPRRGVLGSSSYSRGLTKPRR